MEVFSEGPDWVSFDDGARASWEHFMVCTCLTARRQSTRRNCCKHIVYAIRTKLDVLANGHVHDIPVVLTDEDGSSAWAKVQLDGNRLYAMLQDELLIGTEVRCRLDARNLVVPYLLGLANRVPCIECTGTETWIESQIIRRVCFWL